MPHAVGYCQIVDALLHQAKRRFRRHSVPQHAHFSESVEIVPAELYYIGTSDIPAGTPKHHQYDDVIEAMTDVPFV